MANGRENLRSLATLTTEERRAISSKAGKASVKARRERRTMAQCAEELLNLGLTDDCIAKMLEQGIKLKKGSTALDGIIAGQMLGALKGNAKCAEFIQCILAQKIEEESSAESFINALKSDTEGTDYECIEE